MCDCVWTYSYLFVRKFSGKCLWNFIPILPFQSGFLCIIVAVALCVFIRVTANPTRWVMFMWVILHTCAYIYESVYPFTSAYLCERMYDCMYISHNWSWRFLFRLVTVTAWLYGHLSTSVWCECLCGMMIFSACTSSCYTICICTDECSWRFYE